MSLPVFSFWDIVLIIIISAQATLLAYLSDPKQKVLILMVPFPFTIAALAVDRPLDATNVAGLILLFLFMHAIRVLRAWHWPIVFAIAASALLYCALALPFAALLPKTDFAFWLTAIFTLGLGAVSLRQMPLRHEPHFRTPLPLWCKLPIIVTIICALVLLKKYLHGFMTVFPMLSVISAYESRYSLWTMSRQISIFLLSMTPMIITCRALQGSLGLPLSLAVSWLVFGVVMALLERSPRQTAVLPQIEEESPLPSRGTL